MGWALPVLVGGWIRCLRSIRTTGLGAGRCGCDWCITSVFRYGLMVECARSCVCLQMNYLSHTNTRTCCCCSIVLTRHPGSHDGVQLRPTRQPLHPAHTNTHVLLLLHYCLFLQDILGHMMEFSLDQLGSRFIQHTPTHTCCCCCCYIAVFTCRTSWAT
jgi:hypothetical protein